MSALNFILVVVALVVLGVMVLYGSPLFVRWMQVRRWRRAGHVLALSYDDGPDDTTTGLVLDVLEEFGVPATFYLVGFRSEKNREMLERVVKSGHELGTHTHMHKNAWKKPIWFEYADAMRGYATLSGFVDRKSAYRPPFGKVTLLTLVGMWLKGRRVEWWTVAANDTLDTFDDPHEVASRMLDEGETCVLMHCHHAEGHRRAYVLDLTRALIEQANRRGVQIVRVSELSGANQ